MMQFKECFKAKYNRERSLMTPLEVDDFFQRGKRWNVSTCLSRGGSVIFPHTSMESCGDFTAAVVQGCLNSGAKRVIVLGVLHSQNRSHIIEARRKSSAGQDISREKCCGIFGPQFPGDQTWKEEYSLDNFCFLWNHAIQGRTPETVPELTLAYPCLSNKEPWKLSGVEQLKQFAQEGVVVATTDFYHHGVAYGTPDHKLMPISEEAERLSRVSIQEGLKCFQHENYSDYSSFSSLSISDGNDVGQLLMYLKGPLKAHILANRLIDTSSSYQNDPVPSWVAVSLIELMTMKTSEL